MAADLGTTIKVRVSFTDDASNAETLTSAATAVVSAAPNTPATGAPTITGTAQVGQTLTAGTTGIMDDDGLTSVSYTYQWIRVDGGTETNISGATASTYTLVAADLGTTIKVRVSFTDDASNAETLTSAATAAVSAAPDPNAHCNALDTSELWCGTLTVGRGSNVAYGYNASLSLGSVAPRTFTHGGATITVNVLLYNGNRLGFYMSSALGAGDFSLEIGTGGAKRSFAMNDPGTETEFFNHGLSWSANETVPVKLLLVNTPATGAPAITGTAQVGQTLTATLGDIADVDGLPDPFLTDANTSFQWIRVATDNSETDIGAMAGAYTLVADDQGTTIKVKVSFTGNNGFAETRTSAATAAVSATAAVVPANWSLKPTGRAAGDQFRLLFLSSTKRNGSSTDIATYNTFVQERAAAGHADIRTYSAGFRAVGCTSDVDARDNTRTTGTGVPIYWLNGAKAADNYADFYDGSWDDEVNDKNESGTNGPDTSQSVNRPFTGCEHNGTEALDGSISQGFGAAGGTKVGRPNSSSALHGPLSSNAVTGTANTRPLYGLSEVFQVAAAVVVPNNPPAFSADTAARSVAENTAAGQNVGAALTATDADSDTLTYTLEGADAASFDIVSGSGQIRTRTGVTYNHEAKSTHTVVVKADDGNGGTDTVTVTITVTDVDEPPGRPAAPTVSATAGSTTSLDVTWTAPTNTGPAIASYDLQYRAGTSGNFTNGPQNVTGTSAAIGSLAADTSYEVQVRATNAEGDGDWSVAGTGRTTATSAPGAPTGLTATASGATAIDLSWSAPASTGGSAITGLQDRGLLQRHLRLDRPGRQHQQHRHHLRAHRARRRHHAPLPRLRHQRQRRRRPLQRRQRHHGRHRPRRPDRPHGHGQRDHRDQPLLECPGQHRRLRHHRLQDRGLLQWHLQLDQPRCQHQQHRHDLRPHRACLRRHPPLPRLRHQHQRHRHRLQRRQRHHGPDDGSAHADQRHGFRGAVYLSTSSSQRTCCSPTCPLPTPSLSLPPAVPSRSTPSYRRSSPSPPERVLDPG